MKKAQSSRSSSKKILSNKESLDNKTFINSLDEDIGEWKKQAYLLSYEESLNALELLLENLQNDSVPLEKLQEYHLKASIYLDHCQKLLDNAEHKVIELDSELLGK